MVEIMGIMNLTPDSFFAPSRVVADEALSRAEKMVSEGASMIDIGAVSTRPGASDVDVEQEWERLSPALSALAGKGLRISIDTTSSVIVRRCFDALGDFIVNDISAGEDDPAMLETVGSLGLEYIAMHKRGNPRTMDSKCDYEGGVVMALKSYFEEFDRRADAAGVRSWILDPGLGFAKTAEQNWEILEQLPALKALGKPILIGAADKRFTGGDTERAHRMALAGGADILRVHNVPAAVKTVEAFLSLR